ncbi:MAG: hypothetical protein PWP46_459 [Fusobacteriaceae bacterium]|jgi:hypothetical protein|nr:hypothetical protein [Fusobacteriaceae bacterium]
MAVINALTKIGSLVALDKFTGTLETITNLQEISENIYQLQYAKIDTQLKLTSTILNTTSLQKLEKSSFSNNNLNDVNKQLLYALINAKNIK